MRIAATVAEMRAVRRDMTGDVGFVPTLGALHEGHLSLVRAAREQNQHTVASIFVNPAQFGEPDDFASYPRDPERDLALLCDEGVDIVFLPESAEIYPADASTFVEVERITDTLEGEHRPGHFRGVATVVTKLFQIVQPQPAYFGQKDAPQPAVIRRLVRALPFALELVATPPPLQPHARPAPLRHAPLSAEGRQAAVVLSRALRRAEELFAAGERDGEALRSAMRELIAAEPQAQVDYVSVADTETLRELARVEDAALASLAVRIGGVRLIDNVELKSE